MRKHMAPICMGCVSCEETAAARPDLLSACAEGWFLVGAATITVCVCVCLFLCVRVCTRFFRGP